LLKEPWIANKLQVETTKNSRMTINNNEKSPKYSPKAYSSNFDNRDGSPVLKDNKFL
jgi:hypothetical protein